MINLIRKRIIIVAASAVLVLAASYSVLQRVITGATQPGGVLHQPERKETQRFRQIQFLNDREGWAISSNGLWKTINGGATWDEKKVASAAPSILGARRADFAKMQFIARNFGWLLEDYYLLRTSDEGTTWERHDIDGMLVRGFQFTSPQEGWVAGVSTKGDRRGLLLRTNDGGITWTRSFVSPVEEDSWGFIDVRSVTQDNIWAVGTITVHSTDRGKTWKEIDLPEGFYGTPSIVSFANVDLGWIITNQGDKFLVTTNGGATWNVRAAPSNTGGFSDLVYVNASEAWGISNGLYHTRDGGETWTRVGEDKIYAIQYSREQGRLFAAGSSLLTFNINN